MNKREHAMPEPIRSATEVDFVLRDAKRRRGPELLRGMARADEAKAPPRKTRRRAKQADAADEPRKTWL